MPAHRTPIILDIEASGFGSHSYPIEVGVAMDDGRKFCALVRPKPEWTHWDARAEAVHGVSRDTLVSHGRPPQEVAGALNELLRGRTAYSDGWVVDQPWLERLFDGAAIRREFRLSSLEMILSEDQMIVWTETKQAVLDERHQQRHRASYDAFVVQETFQRTLELAGARLAGSADISGGSVPR